MAISFLISGIAYLFFRKAFEKVTGPHEGKVVLISALLLGMGWARFKFGAVPTEDIAVSVIAILIGLGSLMLDRRVWFENGHTHSFTEEIWFKLQTDAWRWLIVILVLI